MHRTITDIRQLNAELDAEDQELMKMFPRRRETVCSEMLMVYQGEEIWLLRKADVARRRKLMQDLADLATFGLTAGIMIADTAVMTKRLATPLVGLPILGFTILAYLGLRYGVNQMRKKGGAQ